MDRQQNSPAELKQMQTWLIMDGDNFVRRIKQRTIEQAKARRDEIMPEAELFLRVLPEGE